MSTSSLSQVYDIFGQPIKCDGSWKAPNMVESLSIERIVYCERYFEHILIAGRVSKTGRTDKLSKQQIPLLTYYPSHLCVQIQSVPFLLKR